MKRKRTVYDVKRFRRTVGLWTMTVLLFLISTVCHVRGSQEFYLSAGDTMVIPCLAELWSDQHFDCAIGNPDVLMLDGSGRAVIALGEGTSEVYVHLTNPDTDVQYTFVVTEPAVYYDAPSETEWMVPDVWGESSNRVGTETGQSQDAGGAADGTFGHTPTEQSGQVPGEELGEDVVENGSGRGAADGGSGSGQVTDENGVENGSVSGQGAEGNDTGNGRKPYSGIDSIGGVGYGDERDDYMPPRTDHDLVLPAEAPAQSEPAPPFWENTANGGMVFEHISTDDFSGYRAKDAYIPLVRIESDGEVRPVFASVDGREVRWKYIGGVLYVRSRLQGTDTVRVGVLDCRGRMYYFSLSCKKL